MAPKPSDGTHRPTGRPGLVAGLERPPPVKRGVPATRRRPRELPAAWQDLQVRLEEIRRRAHDVVDEHIPVEVQKEAHRKGFHMFAGIAATPLVLYTGLVFTTFAALATLVVITAVELLQARYKVAVPVLTRQLLSTRRPGERFSWASTMFLVAALAILWIAPLPIALAALAMLGLGDGVSALIGKAFGRNKLWYNRRKSWEGSLAGFLAGALGAMGLTAWYYATVPTDWPFLAIVPISVAGALAATIAESLPQWEDNFSVPIASSATMMVLWLTTGLTPRFGALIDLLYRLLPTWI